MLLRTCELFIANKYADNGQFRISVIIILYAESVNMLFDFAAGHKTQTSEMKVNEWLYSIP